jgi:hypothetical protein
MGSSVYPANVKSFVNRTDGVDTVYAANVDDLQNEVNAVESTVGVNPHVWGGYTPRYQAVYPLAALSGSLPLAPYASMTSPQTYLSVADRLNQLQTQVAWLTAVNNRSVTPGPPIWRGPVGIIRCPGAPFLGGFNTWAYFPWGSADYDPNGMFQGGTTISCPQTGWYRFSLQVWSDVAVISGVHHANTRLMVNGVEAGTHGSQVQYGVVDQHRMNLSYEGPWTAGQTVAVQFNHTPPDANNSTVTARSTISISYLRDVS